jgi:spore maturation protein CgeB
MKALYLDWNCFKGEDLCYSLTHDFGFTLIKFSHPDFTERVSEDFLTAFDKICEEQSPDFCISYNFYPLLAEGAHQRGLKYISLVYDCPFVKLYSYRITYPENYVFLFDHTLYEKLKKGGVPTVYYSTLPVNSQMIQVLLDEPYDRGLLGGDVSFVGSLYNEEHNLFDRMYQKLNDYTKGYLDSIMSAQLQVFGYNFIEDLLSKPLIDAMHKAEPYTNNVDGVETLANIYADYYINRKLTAMERLRLLTAVGKHFSLKLYTKNPHAVIPGAKNMGAVDYYMEMPYVFHDSKINLNITLRSIQSGIPLRCMDIMSCGGFLLTNYQSDFLMHFVPDEDFVYYEDEADLLRKIDYYLAHERAREAIAASGYEKVAANHSFPCILSRMFDIAGIQ